MASTTGPTTRWGILATGRIARSFADNLRDVPGAEIAAVGSRSQESADAFAAAYGARRAPTRRTRPWSPTPTSTSSTSPRPHSFHLENARLAFDAGKHVLCEKPLTLNLAEAEAMVVAAHDAGLFLMEAMWMACHPLVRAVVDGLRGRAGTERRGRRTRASGSWCRRTHRPGCATPRSARARCWTWGSTR